MKRKIDARMIVIMALLIAMMVVLSQVLGISTPLVKITFTFVPEMIMAILFGPFWTAIGAVLADLIGMALFPTGVFFIGFTINALVGGLVYGFYFYKKEITWVRAFLCVLTNTILISLILTPIWLAITANLPLTSWAIWSVRIPKVLVMLPIQTILVYLVGRAVPLKRIAKRFI
ncbi:folate ECF transporter [Enterococcus sp. JM9B]|nr:folate ECF transporter [Enterococcus sp. JM9B]